MMADESQNSFYRKEGLLTNTHERLTGICCCNCHDADSCVQQVTNVTRYDNVDAAALNNCTVCPGRCIFELAHIAAGYVMFIFVLLTLCIPCMKQYQRLK